MLKNYEVAVVFGGVSSENEVSVITGVSVCKALTGGGVSVLPVYVRKNGETLMGEELLNIANYRDGGKLIGRRCAMSRDGFVVFKGEKPKRFVGVDCVLNCCHGGVAEGGAVAACAELNGIPCASPSLFESAAFMDKYYTKLLLRALRITTAKYAYSRDIEGAIKKARAMGYPVIVKPSTLGSSIGVFKAEDENELKEALEVAFELDGGVLLEEYFPDRRELNCAAYYLGGEVVVTQCEEVSSCGDVLTYDDKYCGGGSRKFPVSGECEQGLRNTASRVYSALNMRGIVRFDFIVANGKSYLSEINTVPGSLSQYLIAEGQGEFVAVLKSLLVQAKEDFSARCGKRIISTGILNNLAPNACKLK